MDEIGPGTLKCVVGHSPSRPLRSLIAEVLGPRVSEQDIRILASRRQDVFLRMPRNPFTTLKA